MNSSSDPLAEIVRMGPMPRELGFAVVVAFDYYDGPERGLALYPSGQGVRFSSLGDSESRFLRAFELVAIAGRWLAEVRSLQQAAGMDPPARVLVPAKSSSDVLAKVELAVLAATPMAYYVGAGTPNLEKMSVLAVTAEQLDELHRLGRSPAAFDTVYRLLKEDHL